MSPADPAPIIPIGSRRKHQNLNVTWLRGKLTDSLERGSRSVTGSLVTPPPDFMLFLEGDSQGDVDMSKHGSYSRLMLMVWVATN